MVTPPTSNAAPQARAPAAPVSVALSAQAQAEFMELKRNLGHIISWELTSNRYDVLPLKFTEAGSEAQAQALQKAIQ